MTVTPRLEAGGRAAGRRHGQPCRPRSPVYAALDLGTNNCRLLIARRAGHGFRVIDAFSRIVRLGEGLASGRHLSEVAIERTIAALQVCAAKMRRRAVSHARAVATEACRRAENGASFLARVAAETGLSLEVISPAEEARLAVSGCLPLLDPAIPYALLFDIGGGSTELVWLGTARAGEARMLGSVSLPLGVVAFAERYGGRHVGCQAYGAMMEEVGRQLSPFDAAHGISAALARGEVQMLGTSGTVTTIAGVHLDLARYDRTAVDGTYLSLAVIKAVCARLSAMAYEERVAHPCIGLERADLVIAGLAILEAICGRWPVGRLRVADRGLREGILVGLMRARAGGG